MEDMTFYRPQPLQKYSGVENLKVLPLDDKPECSSVSYNHHTFQNIIQNFKVMKIDESKSSSIVYNQNVVQNFEVTVVDEKEMKIVMTQKNKPHKRSTSDVRPREPVVKSRRVENIILQDGPPRQSSDGSRPNNNIYATPRRRSKSTLQSNNPLECPLQPQYHANPNPQLNMNVQPIQSSEPQLHTQPQPQPQSQPQPQQFNVPTDYVGGRNQLEFNRSYVQPPLSGYPPRMSEGIRKGNDSHESPKRYRIFPLCYNLKCKICNVKHYPRSDIPWVPIGTISAVIPSNPAELIDNVFTVNPSPVIITKKHRWI